MSRIEAAISREELWAWSQRLLESGAIFTALERGKLRTKKLFLPTRVLEAAVEDQAGPEAETLRQILFPLVFRRLRIHPGIPLCGRAWIAQDQLVFEEALIERVDPEDTREQIRDVGSAAQVVAAAHSVGVVHLDIKPAHIARDIEGRVSVLDWETALPYARYRERYSFGFSGTPLYMAPEQARGDMRELSPATDVFGLGLVLWETLHARGARCATGTLLDELSKAGQTMSPCESPVKRRWPCVSRVCERATAHHPCDRHEDASLFATELKAALDQDA